MDVKLNNATGELYVEKGDIQFLEQKKNILKLYSKSY